MIAVGLGLRPGTGPVDIRACIEAALGRLDLDVADIGCLATVATRAAEPGLIALAAAIGAPVIGIPDEALRGQDAGCATRSTRVVALFGVGSVAEAAALAAAGASASLILPRIVMGRVTCALARGNRP
ncbi:cobalamin biosynthesis protein [Phreatobacter stygius]|uniref:Cobalamin biosynthesis protein n=1 Tax=Phreatobacter stygius TaxID=1940610 RepID=A0A4D7BGJ7_9HYPH|nr:cobalamin biosynthesis protein [Phreatobacter stygius]QCI68286.1 cobalamin biosynthesis protein [Phreatobacter stygius]